LGIFVKEYKSTYTQDTCTAMFKEALFTILKPRNQPRCPTTNDWVNKMRYIYTHTHTQWSIISHKEEWSHAICKKMDGTRDHYVK
jgi:hypothetical protein